MTGQVKNRLVVGRLWMVLLCLVALLAACDDEENPDPTVVVDPEEETAQVRALHLSPDGPAVDIFVNKGEEALVSGLSFTEGSDYAEVPVGAVVVDVSAEGTGADQSVLSVDGLVLSEDRSYTVAAFGKLDGIRGVVLEEATNPPGAGNVRVRAIHTADGVGQVDIWDITNPNDPAPLYENLNYGSVGSYSEIPSGTYRLGIDVDDDGQSDLSFQMPSLSAGLTLNIFAVADDDGPFLLAQFANGDTARIDGEAIVPPVEESQVRVVHLSPGAPDVDIFANEDRAVEGLAFPDGTDFLTVPVGDYDFAVVPEGGDLADAVGELEGVSLGLNRQYTAFAYGDVADLQVAAFEEDLSDPGNNIRVRAIHAAQGVGQVDIWNITNPNIPGVLFADVGFGDISDPLVVPSGAYTLGIDADNDGQSDFAFELPALVGGAVVNIFAVADDDGPFLVAQFENGDTTRIDAEVIEPPVEEAQIRAIHLSPDAPGVDIFANSDRAIEGLEFPNSTDFVTVPAGIYDFTVVPADGELADRVGGLAAAGLSADTQYTAVAFGNLEQLRVQAIVEDLSEPADGNIRVRAIHAAQGVGQVDIWNITDPENPAPLYENVDFGVAGDAQEIPAGAYTLGIDVNNDAEVDLTFILPELAEGTIANLFAVADEEGAFLIAQFANGDTARINPEVIEPPVLAQVRAIHLSPDAPTVDIFANEARAIEDLEFPNSTGFLAVPAGTYDFSVVAADADLADAVGVLEGAELMGETEYTAFAFGSLENLQVSAFADDTSAPGEGNIRVRAIHAAEGVGQVDIWNITDIENPAPLYENVDFGVAGDAQEIPAGTYTLGIDTNDDAEVDLTFVLPELADGTVANLFAVADENGAFLVAQFANGDTARIDPFIAPIEEALVRAIHLSPNVPAVDVFANEDRAIEALFFPDSTDFLTVPAGAYDFSVVVTGGALEDAVGVLEGAELMADMEYTAFAFGAVESLQVSAFADDTSAPLEGNIRVRAIHAAEGVGQVDIWNITDPENPAPLYEDVDFGVAGDAQEIPAGAYTLGIDTNDDAEVDLTFILPELADGTVANLFAVADENGAFLIAQFANGDTARIDPFIAPVEEAQVRAIHLSPDAPTVDIFANEARAIEDLEFPNSTGFLTVPAGTYDFSVVAADAELADAVGVLEGAELMVDMEYTAFAFGSLENLQVSAFADDTSAPGEGNIRVRAVHAAEGVGQVDIWNITDIENPTPLYENVDFGVAGDAQEIPAGAYTLGIDVNDDAEVDLTFILPELAAGTVANLFAVADENGAFLIAQFANGDTARINPEVIEPPVLAQVRAIHLSPDAPTVDIFANEDRAIEDLEFPNSTGFLTVPAGTYDFSVAAADAELEDAVGALEGAELMGETQYTAFAFGSLENLQVSAFADDTSDPAAGNIRVRAIHAAEGVGQVDIWNITDIENPAPLYENVDFGVAGDAQEIPAGAYTLGIDVNDDSEVDLTFILPELAAGTVANLFAVADENGAFLIAQFANGDTARINPEVIEPPVLAQVRAIHLSPDAPTVDIFANEARAIEDLEFPNSTGFLAVPAGTYDFSVVAADADLADAVGVLEGAELMGETEYTAFAFGSLENLQVSAFADDTSAPGEGNIRVRAIHAAEGVGQVDIWNITDIENPAPLYENVDFGVAGDAQEIPAGAYTLGIDVNDDAEVDLTFILPELAAGTVANLFAVADENGAFLVAQFANGDTARIDPFIAPVEEAQVRAIHLSPDAPTVDIFANEARAIEDLEFPNSTGFLTVPAGTYDFSVVATDADLADAVGVLEGAELMADMEYTAFAFGSLESLQVSAFADDTSEPLEGNIRVRAIHAAEGVGQVDIWNITDPENPAPLYEDVDFGVAGDAQEIPAGAYTLGIDTNDDAEVDLTFILPELADGTVANLFAVADENGAFLIAQFANGDTARIDPFIAPVEEAQVRAIHLSPDAPTVDIFANEARAIEDLEFPNSTGFLTVPAGTYDFSVVAADAELADAVGVLEGAELMADMEYTAFAFGSLENLQVSAFADDTSEPLEGNIRVRAIHAAEGVGQVDIWNITDIENPTPLYENVDFGVAGDAQEIPAGTYTLGIDVNDDAEVDLTFVLPELASGTVANLFAVADENGAFLIAQFANGDTARIDPIIPVGDAQIRAIHLSLNAPPVDVFANDLRAFEGIAFTGSSVYADLQAGTYDLNVVPSGALLDASVLSVEDQVLEEDQAYTTVAFGILSDLQSLVLEEDRTAPAEGNIRVRAIHTALNVGQVDIWNITDPNNPAPLYQDVDFGTAGDAQEIPAGAYTLGLDLNNDAAVDLTYELPSLPAGTIANLFAVARGRDVFLIAQFDDGTTARIDSLEPLGNNTRLRTIHLIPDAPAVDVALDAVRLFRSLSFGLSSNVLTFPSSTYTVSLVGAGAPLDQVAAVFPDVTLTVGTSVTAFAYGSLENANLGVIPEDFSSPAAGTIRVRAIHAAEGIGQVDIWNITDPDNPAPLYEDVDFGAAGNALDIPAGAYTLGIDTNDDAAPELLFELPELAAGTIVNLFAVADADGAFLVAQFGDNSTARIDPLSTDVRVLHLSPDAPSVDVFANGARAFENLAFNQGTDYAQVPAGSYEFNVVPTGDDIEQSVLTAQAFIDPDLNTTVVAFDEVAQLQPLVLTDDLSAPAEGNIRVRAVHTAVGVGQVDIWNITDLDNPAPLYENVDFGVAGDALEIPAGTYTLGIDVDDDASVDLIFELPELAAGTIANLFAVNDGGAVSLTAQFSDSSVASIAAATTNWRIAHFSPDAPPVDIYLDGELTFAAVAFPTGQPYQELISKSYTLDIVPAGLPFENSLITIEDVFLPPSQDITTVAFDQLAQLRLEAFVDDNSPVLSAQTRIRAIHTAVGVGPVDIWDFTDPNNPALLYDELGFGEAGQYQSVPAGLYTLAIDTNNDAVPELTFDVRLTSRFSLNIFAVAEGEDVFLVFQFPGGQTVRFDPTVD